MFRFLILLVLFMFVGRAFWQIVDGIVEGLKGPSSSPNVPARGMQMVRDPVCGTFLLPEKAITLLEGRQQVYFCSTGCRDKYRARTA